MEFRDERDRARREDDIIQTPERERLYGTTRSFTRSSKRYGRTVDVMPEYANPDE